MTPDEEFELSLPSTPRYLRIVRASAWYDLFATAAFATPWTFHALWQSMNATAAALGIAPMPTFDPAHVLFANLMGSLVLVWATLRLWRTEPVHGLADGVGRTLFAFWQAVALLHGATVLIVPFLVVEVAFGVAQLGPVVRGWFRGEPALSVRT